MLFRAMPLLGILKKVLMIGLHTGLLSIPAIPLGYYAWDTYQLLVHGPEVPRIDGELPRLERREQQDSLRISTERVAGWKLFGEYREEGAAQESAEVAEVSDATDLRLLGVFNTGKPLLSSAIVARSGEEEHRRYYAGTRIDPETRLRSVHPNYVILKTPGGLEKLLLEEVERSQVDIAESPQTAQTSQQNSSDEEAEQGEVGPIRLPGMKPVKEGQSRGYRITETFVDEVSTVEGLRAGDVIKRINGYPLGTEAQDRLVRRSFRNAESMAITVMRDGEQITVRTE